jgi:hypothetical protein
MTFPGFDAMARNLLSNRCVKDPREWVEAASVTDRFALSTAHNAFAETWFSTLV